MTEGSMRSLGPGLVNDEINGHDDTIKDYTVTPPKSRSSYPLHLSVFNGAGTRSEENIPSVSQCETAFNEHNSHHQDILTGKVPHVGRLRTSSLTSDASSQRSKGVDSGNSSLIDSSSTDSYPDFGGGRSRTTSTSKSDQNLTSVEHHGFLVGHTRSRHPSSNDSVAGASVKLSLNASGMTDTLEDSWPSALNEDDEFPLPLTFENELDKSMAASHPFLNTPQSYTNNNAVSDNTCEFQNGSNKQRYGGDICSCDQYDSGGAMNTSVLKISPGQNCNHSFKTRQCDTRKETVPLLNGRSQDNFLDRKGTLIMSQTRRGSSPLRRSSSLSNIPSTPPIIKKYSPNQPFGSKPQMLSPTTQQGSTQCSQSQAGNSISSYNDQCQNITSTNSHITNSLEETLDPITINCTETEAASNTEHVGITPIPTTYSVNASSQKLKSVLGHGAPLSWSSKKQEQSSSPPYNKPLQVLVPRITNACDDNNQEPCGTSQEASSSSSKQDSNLPKCEQKQDVNQTRSIIPSQTVHHRPRLGPQTDGTHDIPPLEPVQVYPQPYQTPIPQVAPLPYQPYHPYFINIPNPWIPNTFVPPEQNLGRQYPVYPENIPSSFVPMQGVNMNPLSSDQKGTVAQGPNNQFYRPNKPELAFYGSLYHGTPCLSPERAMTTNEWLSQNQRSHQRPYGMCNSLPESRMPPNVQRPAQQGPRYSWPASSTPGTTPATNTGMQGQQLNVVQAEQQQQYPIRSVPPTMPLSVTVDFASKASKKPDQTAVQTEKGKNCRFLGRLRKRYQQADKTKNKNEGEECQQPLNEGFSLHVDDENENEYEAGMVFNIDRSRFDSGFLSPNGNNAGSPRSHGQSTTPPSDEGAPAENNRNSLLRSNTSQVGLIGGGHNPAAYRAFQNRETPDYKILCLVAAVFNPFLGLIAFFCNHRARRDYRQHRFTRANNLYFSTIALSTGGIFITLISIALLVARIAILNPGSNLTPTVDPTLLCEQRLFGHDDSLMTFFNLDMKLYCQLLRNERVMSALTRYQLVDAKLKKQARTGNRSYNKIQGEGQALQDLSGNSTKNDISKDADKSSSADLSARYSESTDNASSNKNVEAKEKSPRGDTKAEKVNNKERPSASRTNARSTVRGSDKPYVPTELEKEYEVYQEGNRISNIPNEEEKLSSETNPNLSQNNSPNTLVLNTEISSDTLRNTTEVSVEHTIKSDSTDDS